MAPVAQVLALRFIAPGKPNEIRFVEHFSKIYREEALSAYLFEGTPITAPRDVRTRRSLRAFEGNDGKVV